MPEGNCANHIEHEKTLIRLETKVNELEKRVYSVESKHDVNEEKFRQIFEKLDEIIAIIKVSQNRMPNAMWGIGGSVTGGVIVWLILEFLKR